jgi:hypothetical protein
LVLVEVKPIALALILVEEEDSLGREEVDPDYLCGLGVKRGTSLKGIALR